MTDILTRLAAFIDKSESGLWSEHWYGSPPDKGSSIWALDSYGQKARMLVYVGETEAHHQLSTEIVALHNNVASRQAALIALVQEAAGEIERSRGHGTRNLWRPIETALKDEKADAILLGNANGNYAVCTWYAPVEKWMFCQTGNTFVFFEGATHWMPLTEIETLQPDDA